MAPNLINRIMKSLQHDLRMFLNPRLKAAGLAVVMALAGCELSSPEDAAFDFINHFGAAKITTYRVATYDFLTSFARGVISPSSISSILTPNGKPVYVATAAQIDGQERPGFILIPPAQISFDNVPIGETAVLEFGVGKYPGTDDGVLASVTIELEGVRDTVYRRFLNTRDSVSHRRWFDEQIVLDAYVGRSVKITFAGASNIAPGQFPPFLAWGTPALKSSGAEGTPNGKGAFVLEKWEIGGVRRDAIVTLAGASAEFDIPASREGEFLFFGAGMKHLIGDGGTGLVLVELEGRRDTVYRRALNPAARSDDRRWFNETVLLSTYTGKAIRIIFTATPGPANDATADWFAWGTPVLTLPRR